MDLNSEKQLPALSFDCKRLTDPAGAGSAAFASFGAP
jgi:hypothetical protein